MIAPSGVAKAGERGFIVISVLWILGALAALVLIYLSYVTSTAMVVVANTDRPQTDAMVTGGIELAAYQLIAVPPEGRPDSGRFETRMGPHRIAVTFVAETGRIDLNAAPKALLIGLFTGLGARVEAAESYADRIVAWRTKGSDDGDAETALYRASGAPYGPRHGPFPVPDELWLVRGIPSQFIERALPLVTTFSNQTSVHVAAAAPQVIAALPGMTPDRLQAVLAQRADPASDPRALPAAPGPDSGTDVSKAYRVTVAVTFDNGRRSTTEAVILLLDGDSEPYRVLAWRNLFDGDATLQQNAIR